MANNNNPNPINPPVQPPFNILTAPVETLTPEQLQHRRNIVETIELERKNEERNGALAQVEAARKANADNMVMVHQQEVLRQSACTHIKPRGLGTALAGQKTHRGWYTFVCQYCGKNFSDPPQRPEERVPQHLIPDMALVGGPH